MRQPLSSRNVEHGLIGREPGWFDFEMLVGGRRSNKPPFSVAQSSSFLGRRNRSGGPGFVRFVVVVFKQVGEEKVVVVVGFGANRWATIGVVQNRARGTQPRSFVGALHEFGQHADGGGAVFGFTLDPMRKAAHDIEADALKRCPSRLMDAHNCPPTRRICSMQRMSHRATNVRERRT